VFQGTTTIIIIIHVYRVGQCGRGF
jgi:hypothetical protein